MRRLSMLAVLVVSLGCPAGTIGDADGGAGGGTAGGSSGGGLGGSSGGSGGTGGGSGGTSGGMGGTGGSGNCMAEVFLSTIGRTKVLAGAQMADATAAKAPFGLHYVYLSAGVPDGEGTCASCATNCTSGGRSCANSVGCGWWGCYQYDQDPPGAYVRDFVKKAKALGQIPMFTWYELLQSSGGGEGMAEVVATADANLMKRYFNDYRFMLQQIGQDTALVHLEPDLWGYGQFLNSNPHQITSAVASANPTDCGSVENTFAGIGRCLIAMTRKYAPNVKVGLHASAWATKVDVSQNTNASFDVAAEAAKVGAFLVECGGGDADFVTVEASDRDAGFYQSIGRTTFWDDTNATLPNFHQDLAWAKAVAETVRRPLVWWQLPIGNMTLGNTAQHWKDNRLDYFFAHTAEVAAGHGAVFAFGAGQGDQTNPETDGDHLVNQVKAYGASGGQSPCP